MSTKDYTVHHEWINDRVEFEKRVCNWLKKNYDKELTSNVLAFNFMNIYEPGQTTLNKITAIKKVEVFIEAKRKEFEQ
ncbi:MAG: hypothetical protein V1647_01365 [Pseudomonadota bacterium]